MKCPKCGSKTTVIDIRHVDEDHEDYRERMCVGCSYKFYTVEMEVERDDTFNRNWTKNCRGGKNHEHS